MLINNQAALNYIIAEVISKKKHHVETLENLKILLNMVT
jgi:hypothetical protein